MLYKMCLQHKEILFFRFLIRKISRQRPQQLLSRNLQTSLSLHAVKLIINSLNLSQRVLLLLILRRMQVNMVIVYSLLMIFLRLGIMQQEYMELVMHSNGCLMLRQVISLLFMNVEIMIISWFLSSLLFTHKVIVHGMIPK